MAARIVVIDEDDKTLAEYPIREDVPADLVSAHLYKSMGYPKIITTPFDWKTWNYLQDQKVEQRIPLLQDLVYQGRRQYYRGNVFLGYAAMYKTSLIKTSASTMRMIVDHLNDQLSLNNHTQVFKNGDTQAVPLIKDVFVAFRVTGGTKRSVILSHNMDDNKLIWEDKATARLLKAQKDGVDMEMEIGIITHDLLDLKQYYRIPERSTHNKEDDNTGI